MNYTRIVLRSALDELSAVLQGIVETAEQKSCQRCPYMNVRRECTAEFVCNHQAFRHGQERPLCSGQHKLNFTRPQ